MKNIWKKIIATCCVAVMLMTLPGVNVPADELQDEASTYEIFEETAPEVSLETDETVAETIAEEASVAEESVTAEEDIIDPEITEFAEDEIVGVSNPYQTTQNLDGDAYYEVPCTYFAWQQVYDNTGIALPRWGNAVNWWQGAKNSGYATGSSPQAGAIAVWSGDYYGHVAYVTSGSGNTFTVNEGGRTDKDNTSSHGVVYGYTLTNAVGSSRPYDTNKILLGFIYPSGSPVVSVSFSPWSNDNYTYIRETDASIGMNIIVSGGTCTSTGMYLYDSNGSYLAEGRNSSYDLTHIYFQINAEMGYTLRGGTTYKYKFYAIVNGQTYWSDMYSFTTTPPAVININNCTVSLSTTSYTYNGSARTPSVTVKNGSTTLTSGTDYTVSYSNNVKAGTATVTITGKGYYTGTVYRSFTINKAAATLSFASGSINKTDLNTTFTNTLTKTTDGTVTFKSSNTAVATVNSSSGLVTTKGAGMTTITATASEGTNYYAASASYTLLVGIVVGDNVVATFDEATGAVEFYSNEGELWKDWIDKSGIDRKSIKSIKIKSGTVYLPKDSSFIFAINYDGYGDASSTNLKELNLSNFDTSRVENMRFMFSDCCDLTSLDLRYFNTSKVTTMESMFANCAALTNLDLSNFDTSKVTDMSSMFRCCFNLTSLDLSNFDTSKVADMQRMFYRCESLRNTDLSSFNTSNVMTMKCMFENCSNLTNLDLNSFNTSNVKTMWCMFHGCSSLTNLDLSGFNTSSLETMFCMFSRCSSLKSLDLSGFNTSKVVNMDGTFSSCSSLKSLDLSSFNTSNVTDMSEMFWGCSSLTNLDLSSFDTSNLTANDFGISPTVHIFENCNNLQLLKTPRNQTQSEIVLPYTMYDSAGKVYTELPVLSKSIVLTKSISIQNCSITLSPASYTYDGKEKKPAVTVKNGSIILTNNTDYKVAYSNNVNAGTATVTVTGAGGYTGTATKTFTIAKAAPTLTFASTSITKKKGDAAFTNALTKTTDGTVTFKTSNTGVATVNSTSGLVTIKGTGTAIITATASAGINYKAGSASYTLTVTAPAPAGFSDVQDPSHPYYKAIYWAAEAGITKGYPDGTFGINKACTRSEAVMFLWRMAGKPEPVDALSRPFKDVPKSHAHYKAILWAAQKGITKGYSDGTFGINKTCTRGQIMTFIWRFKGQPAPKAAAKSPFSDVPKNHAYYKAILWGSQNKITNGFSDGTFGINKNCTRGQIVTFLYRAK